MLGTWVNTLAIILGSLIGLGLKGGISGRYKLIVMQAIGLAVVLIGLMGALKTEKILLLIFCLAIGSIVGEYLQIEAKLDHAGKLLEDRFSRSDNQIATGFVTASLLYCVGSMAIVGSLESGLAGNHQTLFAKSVLDGIASIILASTLGLGVIFSAVPVLVYQGAITLSASLVKPLLTPAAVNEMSAIGGLLIMAIGINLLEIKRLKVGNMLPAIFLPLLYFLVRKMF